MIKAAEILNYGTVVIMALAQRSGASCGYCHCHRTAVAMLVSGFAADEMHGDVKRERTELFLELICDVRASVTSLSVHQITLTHNCVMNMWRV